MNITEKIAEVKKSITDYETKIAEQKSSLSDLKKALKKYEKIEAEAKALNESLSK